MARVDIKLSSSNSKIVGEVFILVVTWIDQLFAIPTFMTAQLHYMGPAAKTPSPVMYQNSSPQLIDNSTSYFVQQPLTP